jgi:hippurate hydrolase
VRSFDRYYPATVNSSAQAQLALQAAAATGLQAAVARRTRAGFRFPSTDLTMTITVLRQTATVPGLQASSW